MLGGEVGAMEAGEGGDEVLLGRGGGGWAEEERGGRDNDGEEEEEGGGHWLRLGRQQSFAVTNFVSLASVPYSRFSSFFKQEERLCDLQKKKREEKTQRCCFAF
jgi:hypothetical protein